MSSDCKSSPSAATKPFSRPSVVESVVKFTNGNDCCDGVQINQSTTTDSSTTSFHGKRKIQRTEKCFVDEKRIRAAGGSGSTKTSESLSSSSSSSFVSDEMIGQPRLAYPINVPKKTKSSAGDATVLPSIHGLYPTFPMALAAGQQGGALSHFGLGGTMLSAWDSTALAKLQLIQMNEMIKNYISAMSLSGLLPATTLLPTPGTMMSKKMQDLTSSSSSFVSSSSSPTDNKSTHPGVSAKSVAAAVPEKSETFHDPTESDKQQDSGNQATDGRRSAMTDESSEVDDEIHPLRSTDGATIGVGGEGWKSDGNSQQQQGSSSSGGGLNYLERRRKNNDSARRSRDARRTRIDETVRRVAYLEHENLQIRAMIDAERDYLVRLHRDLVQRKKTAAQLDDAVKMKILGRAATSAGGAAEGREEGHVSSTEGAKSAVETTGAMAHEGRRQILENLSCANPPQLS